MGHKYRRMLTRFNSIQKCVQRYISTIYSELKMSWEQMAMDTWWTTENDCLVSPPRGMQCWRSRPSLAWATWFKQESWDWLYDTGDEQSTIFQTTYFCQLAGTPSITPIYPSSHPQKRYFIHLWLHPNQATDLPILEPWWWYIYPFNFTFSAIIHPSIKCGATWWRPVGWLESPWLGADQIYMVGKRSHCNW